GAGPFSPHCAPCCQRAAGERAGGRVGVDLPSTTKSTEAKPATESTMEAKARSETAMEGEGAGSESTMEAKAASAKAARAKAAPAEADCGQAVIARVRDTEGASAGKGRRSQRRTGCRNRHGGQTNCYLAHHDAHSITLSTPAFVNQTQRSYRGCNGAAQSRGVRQSARYSVRLLRLSGPLSADKIRLGSSEKSPRAARRWPSTGSPATSPLVGPCPGRRTRPTRHEPFAPFVSADALGFLRYQGHAHRF